MRRKSFSQVPCPVAQALDVVGDPWTLLIVRDAMWGFRRFGDFADRLDIPRSTLTDRLSRLVDEGLFDKVAYQDHPERFEYRLTEKGWSLRPVILTLLAWGREHSGLDPAGVSIVDRDSGDPVSPELYDAISGRPISELVLKITSPVSP